MTELVMPVVDIVEAAGRRVMEVYGSAFSTTLKADSSPLTEADLASHRVIADGLSILTPDIPILSEEAAVLPFDQRREWHTYWLVDPLDGTKEFVNRTGEFTVNVALIAHGVPVLGVVGAPSMGITYWGSEAGAVRKDASGFGPIHCETYSGGPLRVVASRSHSGPETEAWLESVRGLYSDVELVSRGSSLKFCLVAEGSAHVYPRLGPTMEWDIAAALAVVRAAGGTVTDMHGHELGFNKADLHNPWFLVRGPGLEALDGLGVS